VLHRAKSVHGARAHAGVVYPQIGQNGLRAFGSRDARKRGKDRLTHARVVLTGERFAKGGNGGGITGRARRAPAFVR
jgi:hypothetical protein